MEASARYKRMQGAELEGEQSRSDRDPPIKG